MSYLDQIIKGTSPETELDTNSSSAPSERRSSLRSQRSLSPTHTSPPQIYLNLLILEASLRAQWLQLRTRRRQHTFFLALLAFWIAYFGYALFLAPREDGSGVGGSIYWVIDVGEKICLIGGIITGILVWGTGQWERGIKWPRRWVYNTNRGLREFNCKVVIIKQSWWSEFTSMRERKDTEKRKKSFSTKKARLFGCQ
ncbi:BgTH12-06800 [Blumeria graminis f. sp. triticale]|uniref:Bgt-570 n=3 Tax=Blumeria graminis TaxID=34373 RepID=A0A061HNH9_BLUGR|nr:Regulatory subunit of Nem1p-Spo7p phosphatase holoenzyme [Blumeria graminis f. sp. tritici 96224]CAD6505868.1 BgTH12-06800 [Blumeria graminis f. sp. triticale]VDB94456.1 Bgt-570 [Blumeria graminis f. sp. tritici]